jgi:hypothetical protein
VSYNQSTTLFPEAVFFMSLHNIYQSFLQTVGSTNTELIDEPLCFSGTLSIRLSTKAVCLIPASAGPYEVLDTLLSIK